MQTSFPSLMHWYGLHASYRLGDRSKHAHRPVQTVRARFIIPGFMDLPFESRTVDRLSPGESATFDLSPVFSQNVLELQEDMVRQAQVTVIWSVGSVEQSTSRVGYATIYRNTSLTWDDTRKISSYITPNEATVGDFVPGPERRRTGQGSDSILPQHAAGDQDLRCVGRIRHYIRPESGFTLLKGFGEGGDY